MKRLGRVIILLVFLSFNSVSAQYISGDVYLYSNGETRFSVYSDISIGADGLVFDSEKEEVTGVTEMFVSKRSGIWAFSLNLGEYETILLDVHLPKNLDQVTSLSGVDYIFDTNDKVLSLIAYDEELKFEVSYRLDSETNLSWLFFVTIFLLLITVIYLLIRRRSKRIRLNHVLPIINDNEKRIVKLLMKKPMRQAAIRKKLDMPKASFSRYMINLENKKLIVRQGEGKNKIVRLK